MNNNKPNNKKKHPIWHKIFGTNFTAIPEQYVSFRFRQGIGGGNQTIWLETCRVCGEILDESATSTFSL